MEPLSSILRPKTLEHFVGQHHFKCTYFGLPYAKSLHDTPIRRSREGSVDSVTEEPAGSMKLTDYFFLRRYSTVKIAPHESNSAAAASTISHTLSPVPGFPGFPGLSCVSLFFDHMA